MNNTEKQIEDNCKALSKLLVSKNRDYGAASFDMGLIGNVVHIWDKASRYKTLILDKRQPSFEGVEDTLIDIAGYAIIGLIILEEDKRKNKETIQLGQTLFGDFLHEK